MKKMWEKSEGKRTDYIQIEKNGRIRIGYFTAEREDMNATCTINDLNKGKFHDLVKEIFGKRILDEILKTLALLE